MTRILIVAPSWVGDAVLAQPLFKRLHQRHRELQLDVLAPAWTHALFTRMPEVRDTLENPLGHGAVALRQRYRLGCSLAERGYDQAIVLPNTFKSALAPYFAHIPLRTGYLRELRQVLLNDGRHLDKQALPLMVERFAALADDRGVSLQRPLPPPQLIVDPVQSAATLTKLGLNLNRPVMALCPGAEYGPAKRWPPHHYAQLANALDAAGYAIWIIGSAKDADIGAEIARAAPASVNLCGTSTLAEAIDILSCAAFVVCNDSGLMHIAAALGRNMVALFGSSSPAFTPPLSDKARIAQLALPCSPCFQRVCPLGHFNCMNQLMPETILDMLAAIDPALNVTRTHKPDVQV